MSDVSSFIVSLATLIGAVLSGIAAIYAAKANAESYRAKVTVEAVKNSVTEIKEGIVTVKDDVRIIEKATNSMHDALVKAVGEASFAAGEKEGLATGRAEEKPQSKGD